MRTEEQLGQEMLAYERKMAKLGRRPVLPVDVKAPTRVERGVPSAIEAAQLIRSTRDSMFQQILDVFADLEALSSSQIADRMGCSAQKLNAYLRLMNEQGYLHKIETRGDRKIVYAYMKTGKEFKGSCGAR